MLERWHDREGGREGVERIEGGEALDKKKEKLDSIKQGLIHQTKKVIIYVGFRNKGHNK